MKKVMALLLLVVAPLSYADPLACDGDSNEAQLAQREYCSAHPGCFMVVGMMKSCEKLKSFLSDIGSASSSGRPMPSDDQVLGALSSSSGKSRGLSACVLGLDASACKQALGFAETAGDSMGALDSPQVPRPVPVMARELTKEGAARLRSAAIEKADQARSAIGLSCDKPQYRLDHDSCMAALGQLDEATLMADRLNRDKEYLAYLPPYEVEGVDYAKRLGWSKRNGQWVNEGFDARIARCDGLRRGIENAEDTDINQARRLFGEFKSECTQAHELYRGRIAAWEPKLGGGGTAAAQASSPGVPAVADCASIQGRIESALSVRPSEAPTELSFYEVECAAASAAATQRVQQWRAGLQAAGAKALASAPSEAELEALDHWDQQQDEKVAEELRQIASEQAASEAQRQPVAFHPSAAALASYTAGAGPASRNGIPPNKRSGWTPPRCEDFGSAVDQVLSEHPFMVHPDNKGVATAETTILARKRVQAVIGTHPSCAGSPEWMSSLLQAQQAQQRECRAQQSRTPGDCENGRDPGGVMADVETALAVVNGDIEKAPDSPLYRSCMSKMSDIKSRSIDYFLSSRKTGAVSSLQVFAWRDHQILGLLEGECRAEPRLARQIEVQRVIAQRSFAECSQLTAGGQCNVSVSPGG